MAAKIGRPSKYEPKFAEWAKKACDNGATDAELADFFDVAVRTIYNWASQHEDFLQALKVGKANADERVKRSLFQRAVGFEYDAVKIFMPAGAVEPVYAKYREKVPPDTTAGIFWLKNRDRDNWRDKQEVEHSGGLNVEAVISDKPMTAEEWEAQYAAK